MGSLSTYLYVDKFLFKGKLAQLFFDGWRSLLREWFGPILRFSCRSSPEQPLASPEQEVISTLTDDNLVEKKRYVSRQKEPTGDIGPKREPKTAGDDTFAATTKVEQEPRIMEWRAPAFQRTQTPRPAEKKQPQRWEDKGFAAARFVPVNGGDGEEEIIEIIDDKFAGKLPNSWNLHKPMNNGTCWNLRMKRSTALIISMQVLTVKLLNPKTTKR